MNMNIAHFMNAFRCLMVVAVWLHSFSAVWAVGDKEMRDSVAADVDSLEVSLLTCSPGTDLYAMFGHSAIRVRNVDKGIDIAFNYGMFDYDSDNFIYRFVKGETDYVLGAEDTDGFFFRYGRMGNEVVEQCLNMDASEKAMLFELLRVNYLPENRTYRYNFLYDNCTTRARDIIEKSLSATHGVSVKYGAVHAEQTYRDILHDFTCVSPWAEFGIDMLLGTEVDKVADMRGQMFIPSIYSQMLDSASRSCNEDQTCMMVREKRVPVFKGQPADTYSFPVTPIVFFWSVFGVVVLISLVDYFKRNLTVWVDALLFSVQGLAGVLVTFLFLFSEHPAVGSNCLVVVYNPLPLVFIYWMLRAKNRRVTCWINTANLTVLALFTFAIPFIPQVLNPAMLPLVLTLLIRALVGECVARKWNFNLPLRK